MRSKPTTACQTSAMIAEITVLRKYFGQVNPSWGLSLYMPQVDVWAPARSPMASAMATFVKPYPPCSPCSAASRSSWSRRARESVMSGSRPVPMAAKKSANIAR